MRGRTGPATGTLHERVERIRKRALAVGGMIGLVGLIAAAAYGATTIVNGLMVNGETRNRLQILTEVVETCSADGLRHTEPTCDEEAASLEILLNSIHNVEVDEQSTDIRAPYSAAETRRFRLLGLNSNIRNQYLQSRRTLNAYRNGGRVDEN